MDLVTTSWADDGVEWELVVKINCLHNIKEKRKR